MKVFHKNILYLTLVVSVFAAAYMGSCKKIDLTRIASIATEPVTNITPNSAAANGNVIDMGSNLTDHGFCWKTGSEPTISDASASAGASGSTGKFSLIVSGLDPGTNYNIRSYIKDDAGYNYGLTKQFKTLEDIIGQWLYYDDGINDNSIGYSTGGDFDVAIRFPVADIQQFAGASVTKVRFFPKEGSTTQYYVTIWEGNDPPDLKLYEFVSNPNIDGWTEYTLDDPYPIKIDRDLWIGYWVVDSPLESHPAGVDKGPAVAGFGDMISRDGGASWHTISSNDLDYNWNLRVYVEDAKGVVMMLPENVKKRNSKNANVANRHEAELPQAKNLNNEN